MTPSCCHKCKDATIFVYPTAQAPTCGPCLVRKVEAAFRSALRRAIRAPPRDDGATVVMIALDYSKYPRLLEFFLDKCNDLVTNNQHLNLVRLPEIDLVEKGLLEIQPLLSVEQRRRVITQLRLRMAGRLVKGGILVQCRSASERASAIFNHLLAGELVVSSTYKDFQLVPLLDDLSPAQIAALEHYIFESAEPFQYSAERMTDDWLHNTERSSERIIEKFMKLIPPEMPSALSNVNATAKKMQTAPVVDPKSPSVCQFCSIWFTKFEADWLPTGLSENTKIPLCPLCDIALEKLSFSALDRLVMDLCP